MCSSGTVMRSSTLRSSWSLEPAMRSCRRAFLPVSAAAARTTRRRRGAALPKGVMRVCISPSWRSELTRDCCVSRDSAWRTESSSMSWRLTRSLTDSARARDSCCMLEKRSSSSGSNSEDPRVDALWYRDII